MDVCRMTALELGTAIRRRQLSCREAASAYLRRIRITEPRLGAFITVLEEEALIQADQVQFRLDQGEELSPLAGVPMAIKDNICTRDIPTTCGSHMLREFRPPYTATAVSRLLDAGAVLLGKTNLDEFAMGGSTETSCFGVTRNPWDPERTPGGSSGGSAAAVAGGEAAYALGSDTGGSIRQPCSFCGVSGIKPTYGMVSRYGLIAYASSMDQIGVIGRDIPDCAAALGLIAGQDSRDAVSLPSKPLEWGNPDLIQGLRIGIPSESLGDGLSEDVRESVLEAAATLERLGAVLTPVELPLPDDAVAAYYVIACAEASSNLSRYDGVRYGHRSGSAESLRELVVASRSEGFGTEVKRRILLGTFALSSGHYEEYYHTAQKARQLIRQGYGDAFRGCDVILCPVAPTTAYRIGERVSDPLEMYLGDVYTVSVNLEGLPAAAVPCGFDSRGLPIGMQLIGRAFDESTLIQAAHAFQLHTDFHTKRPGGAPA